MSNQSGVRSPDSDTERLDLTEFEFDLACDYSFHDKVTTVDAPAVWAVVARNPLTCGCRPMATVRYFCDPCWTHLHHKDGVVYCNKCRTPRPLHDDILRIERIKP